MHEMLPADRCMCPTPSRCAALPQAHSPPLVIHAGLTLAGDGGTIEGGDKGAVGAAAQRSARLQHRHLDALAGQVAGSHQPRKATAHHHHIDGGAVGVVQLRDDVRAVRVVCGR